jgi:hypothetical protein
VVTACDHVWLLGGDGGHLGGELVPLGEVPIGVG